MKTYPEYKNSGVEWSPLVPSHWDVLKTKYLYKQVSIRDSATEELLSIYRDYGVVPRYSRDDNFNRPAEDLSNYKLVRKGFLVINKMKAWQGSLAHSDLQGIVSPAYITCEPTIDFCGRYFHYLFRNHLCIQEWNRLSQGVRPSQWDLSFEDFSQTLAFFPSLPEQQAIADFLDRKTAQIDTLIVKKQRQIDLLQEQRTALINHAVTKGLNPDVHMKDSGVEWLGEIPSHWYVVTMRRMLDVRDGTHETPEYVESNGESISFVTSKDFDGDSINFETAKRISLEDHQNFTRRSKVEKGDVLMSMIGGNIGKALIVSDNFDFSIKNVALLKTYGDVELSKYILYYIRSGLLDTQIGIQSRGGAQSFLSLTDIRNLIFFKLPKQEYASITNFLDEQTKNIERQIRMIQKEINLIQEYRTALISEAVTGKIDVRGNK